KSRTRSKSRARRHRERFAEFRASSDSEPDSDEEVPPPLLCVNGTVWRDCLCCHQSVPQTREHSASTASSSHAKAKDATRHDDNSDKQQAVALYAYTARSKEQHDLVKGSHYVLLDSNEQGWSRVKLLGDSAGRGGWVPTSYIKVQ
ncbi:MAG: hypothetical protein MHM6MM_007556, partial [Cercozoa sp. M6MM]